MSVMSTLEQRYAEERERTYGWIELPGWEVPPDVEDDSLSMQRRNAFERGTIPVNEYAAHLAAGFTAEAMAARKDSGEVVADHLSSKWSGSPASVVSAFRRSVEGGADVVTFTEMADGRRAQVLDQVCERKGWRLLHQRGPNRRKAAGECAMAVDLKVWTVVHWETVLVGPDLGPGLAHVALIAVLRHNVTGHVTVRSVLHLPSAVEGLLVSWRTPARLASRARAWLAIALRWRRAINRLVKKYDPDSVILSGDFNVNFLNDWAVRAMRVWFPSYRMPADRERDGTHGGGRQIDMFLVRLRKGKGRARLLRGVKNPKMTVLAPHRHSDHLGIRLRFTLAA